MLCEHTDAMMDYIEYIWGGDEVAALFTAFSMEKVYETGSFLAYHYGTHRAALMFLGWLLEDQILRGVEGPVLPSARGIH